MSTQNIDDPKTFADWQAIIAIRVHSKGNGRLKDEHINQIFTLYEQIELLKKHGITTDNYRTKIKAYYKFRKKALEEYGIELNAVYPFKNPVDLYLKIHKILLDANLNEKQIKSFYDVSEIRAKIPKKNDVSSYNKKKSFKRSKPFVKPEASKERSIEEYIADDKFEYTNAMKEYYSEQQKMQDEINKTLEDYHSEKQKLKQKFIQIQHKCFLS